MKIMLSFFAIVLSVAGLYAQAPQKMSYQAVVRDASNTLVASSTIGLRISLLQGDPSGTAVYVETQSPLSNENGLVSIEIGMGNVTNGNFSAIDWANGPYFLKTEIDPNGGSSYSIEGVSQLLSVPYALYAEKAGNDLDGIYGGSGLVPSSAQISVTDVLSFDGGTLHVDAFSDRIGIGNIFPDYKLDIADPGYRGIALRNNLPSEGATLSFYTNNPSVRAEIGANGTINSFRPDALYITQYGPHPIKFATNLTDRMLIDATGNVGIGTNDPKRMLHITQAMRLEPLQSVPSSPSE